ncbi:hypothetical protein JK364_53910 [Streptomyces sp. 110]|uniref:Uncharacterized protein n=1 Tax=Streptomyces endocoffeicus TaxID=2898945 RepID=A0ABS1QAS7_9ACTN|nr:hypothetical protein [Streptomyces endocoffeicus]MBL1121061.1 hypothetical protein [Streptomyces endocoffeicus]
MATRRDAGAGPAPGERDIVDRLMSARFHDLAGAPRVPEDPIAHGELSALTRRFEEAAEKNDREFRIIKSDLTAVRPKIGNLDQKAGNLDHKVDHLKGDMEELGQKMDRNQAQIVELLAGRSEPRIVVAPASTTRSEAA